MKREIKIALIVLQPSWFSFSFTALVTLITIIAIDWPYFAAMPELFDFFYGKLGIVTVLERSSSSLQDLEDSISANPFFYGTIVLAFALTISTIAYLTTHILRQFFTTLWTARSDTTYMRQARLQRFFVRIAILTTWTIYLLFNIYIAAPFCLLLWRIGVESVGGMFGFSISAIASVMLYITLHIHVVFARLFFLRLRIFGGETVTELALMDS
ncbi:MAG: hypothetical protein PVI21_02140 [Candidatus Woesebacteria bacterium]|jgi:hypothetical protein